MTLPFPAFFPSGGWFGNLGFPHQRVMGVSRPRCSYRVRGSELPDCFVSVFIPSHSGIPAQVRYGIPILFDYPRMRADIPPRPVCTAVLSDIRRGVVGFTPLVNGERSEITQAVGRIPAMTGFSSCRKIET